MSANSINLAIDTHGLGKSCNDVDALKPLNLNDDSHSIFGSLGPDGAGITTTVRLLLGIIRSTNGGGKFDAFYPDSYLAL